MEFKNTNNKANFNGFSPAQISRLKAYRDKLGLTQTELAKKSNVNQRMIQYYEQFQKNINHAKASTVLNLAQALDCNMEDILEPDEEDDKK